MWRRPRSAPARRSSESSICEEVRQSIESRICEKVHRSSASATSTIQHRRAASCFHPLRHFPPPRFQHIDPYPRPAQLHTYIRMKTSAAAILAVVAASANGASAFVAPRAAGVSSVVAAPASSALSMATSVDDKTEVREYFNTEGFNRWNKIYSDSDEVNTVQLDIRNGHDQTIQKILNWIEADGDISGKTVCDCGCGVGSLAIPLAQMGAKISASDISDSMAGEAAERAKALGIKNAKFYTSDLESVTGKYDTVTCVDVAIHYPTEKMAEMVGHLCSLSNDRVLVSFAPKTWYYSALKKFGELFPGPSKTTRAYLHEEQVVRDALKKAGFEVAREEMTGTNFYFSRLLEAKKV